MKLFKLILALVIMFLVSALLIGVYLGPDSLKFCGAKVGTSGDCAPADAIVVISGGDTAARTDEAIKLYKNGWAPMIILSGAAADTSGPSNAKVMQQRAVAAGVPGEATLLDETSHNTNTNASNSVKLARSQGYTSLIVVTSAYHERRALMEFRRAGNGLTIRPHPVSEDKDWNRFWWMTPWGWNLALSELSKTAITATGGVEST